MAETQELTVRRSPLAVMPVMDLAHAVARRKAIVDLVRSQLWSDGTHSGTIPGTDKPTLLKPGAELLCSLFGLTDKFVLVTSIEDWTGEEHGGEPLFFYHYTCQLWQGDHLVAEADGSCNSWEGRYRYRWVDESDVPDGLDKATLKKRGGKVSEFAFAIDKAETGGKYGKPAEYWQRFKDAIEDGTAQDIQKKTRGGKTYDAWEMDTTVYRIPNDDIHALVNTVKKQAQKRALVAATLLAANASEMFNQDLDDFDGTVIDSTATVVQDDTPVTRPRPTPPPPAREVPDPRDTAPLAENKPNGNMKRTRKASPVVLPGTPEQEEPHWIDAPTVRNKFWAWAKGNDKDQLGLNEDQIYDALQVGSLHQFKGTKEDAANILKAYAKRVHEAEQAQQELQPELAVEEPAHASE